MVVGVKDPVEECRREVKKISISGNFRVTALLFLEDGSRRIYRAKAINRNEAISEILTFVDAIQQSTGQKIMWKLRGENTYHMGTSYQPKKSVFSQLIDYFFD